MSLKDIKTVTINIEQTSTAGIPVPASVDFMMDAEGGPEEVAELKARGDLVLHKGVWCWSLETVKAAGKEAGWR